MHAHPLPEEPKARLHGQAVAMQAGHLRLHLCRPSRPAQVALLSITAAGIGLDFSCASVVVFAGMAAGGPAVEGDSLQSVMLRAAGPLTQGTRCGPPLLARASSQPRGSTPAYAASLASSLPEALLPKLLLAQAPDSVAPLPLPPLLACLPAPARTKSCRRTPPGCARPRTARTAAASACRSTSTSSAPRAPLTTGAALPSVYTLSL